MSQPGSPSFPADDWLTPERYERLHELVDAAATRPVDERVAFVLAASDDDPRFRAEALALLEASETLDEPPRAIVSGGAIGPYRVERELGRGGMGSVYLARRADLSYDKQVAIKLVRPDVGSQDLVARFALETKILASLSHPNIAVLLDAGVNDDGRPYIVMEYVDGVPLTEYADRARLSISERVRLVRNVCAAVDHAHQKLVVHRDIKPSNILVTAEGVPKLLDFGIAKLLTAGGLDAVRLTATGASPGTPLYASPEQMDGGRVDTSADVYALGVVLFELLTGRWPFDPRRARPERAPLLSEAVDSPTAHGPGGQSRAVTPAAVASARGTTVERLAGHLRGDLDAIVATALRSIAHERYRSVAEFSEDLERYLTSLPVGVRPPTPAYRARKFVGRNRAAVAASAVAACTFTAGIAGTYYQWQRAEGLRQRAERRFEGVRTLAGSVLDASGSIASGPEGSPARRALLTSSLLYLEGLEREAGTDPGLLREVAAGYRRVGDAQSAEPDSGDALTAYRRAVQTSERLAANEPANPEGQRELAASLEKVGSTLSGRGDQQEGSAALERSLALYREVLEADRTSAGAQGDLARAHLRYAAAVAGSDPAAARASYDAAREISEALAARDPSNATASGDLGRARDGLRGLDLRANPELTAQQEADYYAAIRDSRDPARLDYFLERYPNGPHAAEVAQRLSSLRGGSPLARPRQANRRDDVDPGRSQTAVPSSTAPVSLDWKPIPSGRFEMGCDMRPDGVCRGDERPRHWVTLSSPFRLAGTETSLAQYRVYVSATGEAMPEQPAWNANDRGPVVNVTWDQARRFCAAVGGRLPTEAEWEWAAIGGQQSVYPWGDSYDRRRANAGFPGRDGWDKTSPSGTFGPNGYGLSDMAGNVWEWVSDWYGSRYYEQSPERDPAGPAGGPSHVLRGGSFSTEPSFLRVTQRGVDAMDRRREATGFRCAQ